MKKELPWDHPLRVERRALMTKYNRAKRRLAQAAKDLQETEARLEELYAELYRLEEPVVPISGVARAAKYRWIITDDHLEDKHSLHGLIQGPHNFDPNLSTNPMSFELYDDDEELYYTGILYGEYDGFEALSDFGMPGAGCTKVKVNPTHTDDGWEWL